MPLTVYKKFFDLSQEMLCIANTEGFFIKINSQFEKLLGFKESELLEKPFLDFIHPDDLEATQAEIEKLSQGHPTINFVTRFRTRDGSYKWLKCSATPDSATGELYAIAHDISDEVYMRTLFEESQSSARIGGWDLDLATGTTFWTKQIYEIYGVPVGETTNVEIGISQYHPEDQDKITKAVEGAIGGVPFDKKLRFIRKDGQVIWVRAKGKPIYEGEKVISVRGIFQDIDLEERMRINLKQNQEMLMDLIRHTPAAVAMFDTDMRYLAHSNRWILDYKIENPDILGKSHYEVFPDIPDRWKADHQRVLGGEVYKNPEDKWEREDKSVFYIRYELRPWRHQNQEIGGLIMFTEVITQQVETRLELEQKNEILNTAVMQLQRSNQELEQFAYIASHDLQEPLRMISNFTGLLEKKYVNQLDEKGQKFVEIIRDSSNRMRNLISNLLEYSRVGKKEHEFEFVDLEKIIQHKLKDLELFIAERNVIIDIQKMPDAIFGEPNQLGIVFYNLMHNAIKFNDSEQPRIAIKCKEFDPYFEFAVSDNGIGIAPEFHEKVFKVFHRLHTKSEYSGTGMGLSLCKKIIERHGGHIWFEPNKEQGTTFRFTIKK